MKRSLSTLVVLVGLTGLAGLAHAESAVEQAPAHLIAYADISDRGYQVATKTPTNFVADARGDLEQVAVDLSKKLEERMERDLRLAAK